MLGASNAPKTGFKVLVAACGVIHLLQADLESSNHRTRYSKTGSILSCMVNIHKTSKGVAKIVVQSKQKRRKREDCSFVSVFFFFLFT